MTKNQRIGGPTSMLFSSVLPVLPFMLFKRTHSILCELNPARLDLALKASCPAFAKGMFMQVLAVSAPPKGTPYPWSSFVVSCDVTGLFCFVSLEQRQCMHVLSSAPGPWHVKPAFLWSAEQGYIACCLSSSAVGVPMGRGLIPSSPEGCLNYTSF